MRIRGVYLFFLIVLAIPTRTYAQQGAAPNDKNAEHQRDVKVIAAPPVENWTALGDIKSGLRPRGSVEVQRDEQAGFVRQLIRVQWRTNDPIDLWVIRPKVTEKAPVVDRTDFLYQGE